MKKATATSHGKRCLEASEGGDEDGGAINKAFWIMGMRESLSKAVREPAMLLA
jgi:hypothetical protein